MRKPNLAFQQTGQTVYLIEFEHYDKNVHSSVDVTYGISETEFSAMRVLRQFALKKGLHLTTWSFKGGKDCAEATYNPMDRPYFIRVTKQTNTEVDSVVLIWDLKKKKETT